RDVLERLDRELPVSGVLIDRAQVVQHARGLDRRDRGGLEALAEPLDRELRHALLEEAVPKHAAALDRASEVLARQLKLADRLVDEAHLLVRDPQVVVRLVVLGRQLLLDALLELAEDLLERDLALRRRDVRRLVGQDLVRQLLLELLRKIEEL